MTQPILNSNQQALFNRAFEVPFFDTLKGFLFYRNTEILTPYQIEFAFVGPNHANLVALVNNPSFTPTTEQIECGLTHHHFSVRKAFAERLDLHLTEEQKYRGLSDPWPNVLQIFIERPDVSLSPKQTALFLSHTDPDIRLSVAERDDFLPTLEQIENGKNDTSHFVRHLFLSEESAWLDKIQHKILNEQFHPERVNKRKTL